MQSKSDIDELITKYISGTLSDTEKARLDEWVGASEMNEALFRQLTKKEFLANELALMRSYDEEKGWSAIRKELDDVQDTKPQLRRWWIMAAASLMAVAVGYWLLREKPRGQVTVLPARQSQVASTSSKSKVVLPDGSVVILNRGSEISYNADFGVKVREINLKGEAYFDVAKNKSIPLIVIAGPMRIRELGTIFNVRAYADEPVVETALIQGAIEVSPLGDTAKAILMHPHEKIAWRRDTSRKAPIDMQKPDTIHAGHLVVEKIRPNPSDSSINEIVWLQDKLVFEHEPFYSLAQKMERWYGVQFVFKDASSERLFLSGSLEKEDLAEALEALSRATPFEYSIQDKVVTIHKKTKPIVN